MEFLVHFSLKKKIIIFIIYIYIYSGTILLLNYIVSVSNQQRLLKLIQKWKRPNASKLEVMSLPREKGMPPAKTHILDE